MGKADRLQPQVVLVRPEPGHRAVRLGLAGEELGDDARLVGRVLHRFEPDRGAVGEVVGMRRAIADREDVGKPGAAECVDVDPVAAGGAGRDQGLDRGRDADADDHEVRRQRLAVGQADAAHAAARALLDAANGHAEADLDAMGAVLGLVEPRQGLAGDAGEHAVHRLEHRDALAQLAQDGSGFEADISAAHDHDMRPRVAIRG